MWQKTKTDFYPSKRASLVYRVKDRSSANVDGNQIAASAVVTVLQPQWPLCCARRNIFPLLPRQGYMYRPQHSLIYSVNLNLGLKLKLNFKLRGRLISAQDTMTCRTRGDLLLLGFCCLLCPVTGVVHRLLSALSDRHRCFPDHERHSKKMQHDSHDSHNDNSDSLSMIA